MFTAYHDQVNFCMTYIVVKLTVNPSLLKSFAVSPIRERGLPEPLVTRSDSKATFLRISRLSTRFWQFVNGNKTKMFVCISVHSFGTIPE